MKVCGIVAEYNPLHNGHKYHIEKAKEITGSDYIIVVMSGDFTQRGIPAVMPKHERAKAALLAGADLVLELPLTYATGSAEHFAFGAVSLMHQLGCVNTICFGAENDSIEEFKKTAHILSGDDDSFKDLLDAKLTEEHNYPKARQAALYSILGESSDILSSPNNILGVEYIKALFRLNSAIEPISIKREGSSYLKEKLDEKEYPSAMALRALFKNSDAYSVDELIPYIPQNIVNLMGETYHSTWPIFLDDFSQMLSYKLIMSEKANLLSIQDINEDLADRIQNTKETFTSFSEYIDQLKTKNNTYTRISRALLHTMLSLREQNEIPCPYARVLGFNKNSKELLSTVKKESTIPLITKLADASALLTPVALNMLETEIKATALYHNMIAQKYGTHLPNEYRTIIPIIE